MKLKELNESLGQIVYFDIDERSGNFILNVPRNLSDVMKSSKHSSIVLYNMEHDDFKDIQHTIKGVKDSTTEDIKEITEAYFLTIQAIMISARKKIDDAMSSKITK